MERRELLLVVTHFYLIVYAFFHLIFITIICLEYPVVWLVDEFKSNKNIRHIIII